MACLKFANILSKEGKCIMLCYLLRYLSFCVFEVVSAVFFTDTGWFCERYIFFIGVSSSSSSSSSHIIRRKSERCTNLKQNTQSTKHTYNQNAQHKMKVINQLAFSCKQILKVQCCCFSSWEVLVVNEWRDVMKRKLLMHILKHSCSQAASYPGPETNR